MAGENQLTQRRHCNRATVFLSFEWPLRDMSLRCKRYILHWWDDGRIDANEWLMEYEHSIGGNSHYCGSILCARSTLMIKMPSTSTTRMVRTLASNASSLGRGSDFFFAFSSCIVFASANIVNADGLAVRASILSAFDAQTQLKLNISFRCRWK